MNKREYTWRCDCDCCEGVSCRTVAEAREEAKAHLLECDHFERPDGKLTTVIIDEVLVVTDGYEDDGLTGREWVVVKPNKAASQLRAIKSEKRTATSRENGKKGGRPKSPHREEGLEVKE